MGNSNATFVGSRNISENMYTVAARIEDADNAGEWLDSCRESRAVRPPNSPPQRPNQVAFDVYQRIKGVPALRIDDRDIYLSAAWKRRDAGLVCTMRPTPNPPDAGRPGVVRMPHLQGTFALQPRGPKETSVTYDLSVDLGGSIPGWVTKRAVKEIPQKTLAGLERVMRQDLRDYAAAGRELKAALAADEAAA